MLINRNTVSHSKQADEQAVFNVAREIVRYLSENENVADTMEGITEWWILKQRLREERQRVEEAVAYLYSKGLIQKRKLADGAIIYSANQKTNNHKKREQQ